MLSERFKALFNRREFSSGRQDSFAEPCERHDSWERHDWELVEKHGASRNVSSLPSPSIGSGRPAVTDAHSLTAELNASLQSSSAAATANGLLHDVAAASQPNSFMLEPRPLTTWCTLASPAPLAPAQQPLWDVRGRQGRQAASLPAESGTPQISGDRPLIRMAEEAQGQQRIRGRKFFKQLRSDP